MNNIHCSCNRSMSVACRGCALAALLAAVILCRAENESCGAHDGEECGEHSYSIANGKQTRQASKSRHTSSFTTILFYYGGSL